MPAKRKPASLPAEVKNDPSLLKKHRSDGMDSTSSKNQKLDSDEPQTRILVTRASGPASLYSAPTRSLPPELTDEKFLADFPGNHDSNAVARVFAFLTEGTFHDEDETRDWPISGTQKRPRTNEVPRIYQTSPCVRSGRSSRWHLRGRSRSDYPFWR